ncbi:MAG: hypothetical protein ACR2PL_03485, partial [Dehalococcoidia bacterium]
MVRLLLGILIAATITGASFLGTFAVPLHTEVGAGSTNLALYHDGWDSYYRSPFGATPTGSHLTLRLRSATAVNRASLYLVASNGSTKPYDMQLQTHDARHDFWSVTLTMPRTAGDLSYYFRAAAGKTVRWYGDNNSVGDGGIGRTYSK